MGRCRAVKRSGEPCKGTAIGPDGYCWAHSPEYAEQRRKITSKAGKRGGRGRAATHTKEIAEVKERIKTVVNGVLLGKVQTSRGNTIAALYHVLLRCIEVELSVREQEELVGRLEELERLLEDRKEAGRWGA
jgi:hypothetical protein